MLICQLTDLHVRPVGQPANRVVETNIFTERAFRAAAHFTPRPDVVVITGDLTESGQAAEYANVVRMLRKWLPMPVFVIPGNHDQRSAFREALRRRSMRMCNPLMRRLMTWKVRRCDQWWHARTTIGSGTAWNGASRGWATSVASSVAGSARLGCIAASSPSLFCSSAFAGHASELHIRLLDLWCAGNQADRKGA